MRGGDIDARVSALLTYYGKDKRLVSYAAVELIAGVYGAALICSKAPCLGKCYRVPHCLALGL